MIASEIAVVESSARTCVKGKRSGAAAFENGVKSHSSSCATHTLVERTLSVTTKRTFRGGRAAGRNEGTARGVRGPG